MFFTCFAFYLLFINIISIIICVFDKLQAKCEGRRISEKTLFALSALGGSTAMYFTMRLIRHKTLHKRFMIGLPLIIVLQCALVLLVLRLTTV